MAKHHHPVDRHIVVKGGSISYAPDANYGDNQVITSKYTWWNFIPKNLFEQFLNLANIYFLVIGIFQIIPDFTTTNGLPTIYQPLAFIVFVSACRSAKEDYDKHVADAKRNGYEYEVLQSDGSLKLVCSGDIKVGNIVKVKQNDMIPADMIFLASSFAKGHAFIDKANLNGETTLEVVNSVVHTRSLFSAPSPVSSASPFETLCNTELVLKYEAPNKHFESFRCECKLAGSTEKDFRLDGKSLLLRETNLRNCDYVYGLCVYTGNDTKIQKSNSDGVKSAVKRSRIMRQVDKFLLVMLCFQALLCIAGAIINSQYVSNKLSTNWYLSMANQNASYVGFCAFFTWFILLSQLVPISLIVSSELVKFSQSLFIQWDLHLYSATINKAAKCNNSTVHEDLGMIDYVFSDKTGTLTQNKMEFRYALLATAEYGSKETEIARSVKTRQQALALARSKQKDQLQVVTDNNNNNNNNNNHEESVVDNNVTWSKLNQPLDAPNFDAKKNSEKSSQCAGLINACWASSADSEDIDSDSSSSVDVNAANGVSVDANTFTQEEKRTLLRGIWSGRIDNESDAQAKSRRSQLRIYMTHLALSNTVKPYEDNSKLKFQAESAEELAMVEFARTMGFTKKQINPTILEIQEYDPETLRPKNNVIIEKYNHVATFGFTSKRARVTVIYQRIRDNNSTNSSNNNNNNNNNGNNDGPDILVMSKGQDGVMLPLVAMKNVNQEDLLVRLKDMSSNGLRTLLAAHAPLPASWWNQREQDYYNVIQRDQSPFSEGHPDKCSKDTKCEKCAAHNLFEKMEIDAAMEYLGCVGMEDQLQPLVPACIQEFLQAGIRVWMITGDKLETAKNIGIACNLIDADMQPQFDSSRSLQDLVKEYQSSRLVEITGAWTNLCHNTSEIEALFHAFDIDRDGYMTTNEISAMLSDLKFTPNPNQVQDSLLQNKDKISKTDFVKFMTNLSPSAYQAIKYDIQEGIRIYESIEDHMTYPISLLVDRAAFQVLFPGKEHKPSPSDPTEAELEELRKQFFFLAGVAKSVVFARAEPAMKKRMVTEIQARKPEAVTLAVGDGANDVDMIQAAHIGVGISGVEGTAATNNADYAVGTFRMLHNLLFVHGFCNYNRVSKLVYFVFYKASLIAFAMFYFGIFTAFSGTQLVNDTIYQIYNVIYTALPIIVVSILDKVLPYNVCANTPYVYKSSRGKAFTGDQFFYWILRAVVHSAAAFFLPYIFMGERADVYYSSGQTSGLYAWSTTVYECIVLIPTFTIVYEMNSINILSILSVLISVFTLFLFDYVINVWKSLEPNLYGSVTMIYRSPLHWLTVFFTVVTVLLSEHIIRCIRRQFLPTFLDIAQEYISLSKQQRIQHNLPSLNQAATYMHQSSTNSSVSPAPTATSNPTVALEMSNRSKVDNPPSEASIASSKKPLEPKNISKSNIAEADHRAMFIRSALRFKNMTGSQFESCASAEYQVHDVAAKKDVSQVRGQSRK